MVYKDKEDLLRQDWIRFEDQKFKIQDFDLFREEAVDSLVDTLVLSDSAPLKSSCFQVIREAASRWGIIPSSIQDLYEARAQQGLTHFTVPAINLRTLTFDSARAVFRAAKKIDGGAFVFEIARSEIGYTEQRPQEYSSYVLLAAIKEEFEGPVFIQGDHFQVNAKDFLRNGGPEIQQLKDLIAEAVQAGFYNIDIDSSTLVDLSRSTLDEQQKLNYEVCALLTRYIRELQPKGIEVSIGGEIGEVGGKNSTTDELEAFMSGYFSLIPGLKGISKISVQTGTSHGGVVLPDGSIAEVRIDFETLKKLSQTARTKFGMAGAVQHGASTLPREAFGRFPEFECAEIHLATGFQNIVYDFLPIPLKEDIHNWLKAGLAAERKPDWTEEQFIYKTRKKALGPFKKEVHSLSPESKQSILAALEEEFSFLFEKLRIQNTREIVGKYIKSVDTAL
jgi:fructose/tagatose bisphosphate aldolase